MEPVSEDTKIVGWRDMPLFNRNKWLSAVLLYAGLFYFVCYFGGSFMFTGKMSVQEKELAEKKKDLERKLAFNSAETENQPWLISTLVKIQDTITPEQRKLLRDSGIKCKFHVNPNGTAGAVRLILPSSDEQKNALVLKLIKAAEPFPAPISEVAKRSTLLLSFKKAPEIGIYRNE
jgi:hypothetical protein